jgi:hypothetical protein
MGHHTTTNQEDETNAADIGHDAGSPARPHSDVRRALPLPAAARQRVGLGDAELPERCAVSELVTVTVTSGKRVVDVRSLPASQVARYERGWTQDLGMGRGRYSVAVSR